MPNITKYVPFLLFLITLYFVGLVSSQRRPAKQGNYGGGFTPESRTGINKTTKRPSGNTLPRVPSDDISRDRVPPPVVVDRVGTRDRVGPNGRPPLNSGKNKTTKAPHFSKTSPRNEPESNRRGSTGSGPIIFPDSDDVFTDPPQETQNKNEVKKKIKNKNKNKNKNQNKPKPKGRDDFRFWPSDTNNE